jgi:hypothetical protein
LVNTAQPLVGFFQTRFKFFSLTHRFNGKKDRDLIEHYADELREVVRRALEQEEAGLIVVDPVYHLE